MKKENIRIALLVLVAVFNISWIKAEDGAGRPLRLNNKERINKKSHKGNTNRLTGNADFGRLSIDQRFKLAIEDAKLATPYEIDSKLISVIPSNHQIQWKDGMVLITSFMTRDKLRFYFTSKMKDGLDQKKDDLKSGSQIIEGIKFYLNESDVDYLSNSDFAPTRTAAESRMYTHGFRGYDVSWVTMVPEVLNFVNNWAKQQATSPSKKDFSTRTNERLGLIPAVADSDFDKVFIEQWVKPEDLFRPASDAEVIDSTAIPQVIDSLNPFYSNIKDYYKQTILDKENVSADQETKYQEAGLWTNTAPHNRYTTWFNSELKGKYAGQWAMPWSQLGYTYDYSQEAFDSLNSSAHFGASEFCIKPQSNSTIVGIYSVDKYFDQANYESNRRAIKEQIQRTILNVSKNQGQEDISSLINAQNIVLKLLDDYKVQYPDDSQFADTFKNTITFFRTQIASLLQSKN